MTKEQKYNDFSVKFTSQNDAQNEDFYKNKKYDLCIFETGDFIRERIFEHSRNQIIFDAGNYNIYLGNFQRYYIVEYTQSSFSFLWTNFKGKPEKIKTNSNNQYLFDYLFLSCSKKYAKVLYFGSSVECAIAAWRNKINLDMIYTVDVIPEYLKKTQETYLPF